ncbi:MAG TPA: SLBB domain-containing protein [Sedimentisphaerales bacterium]|nr:SLBB domain-containing protein [Sedimentisphaerales bacterium]HRV46937.1 SLBB domain-containing protein [Sedimentisphaerales bacterium]
MIMTRRTIAEWVPWCALLIGSAQCLSGCGDRIQLPSAEKLAAFENAGPSGPVVDMTKVVEASLPKGPYRVHVSDVLELQLPALLYPDIPAAQPAGVGRNAHVSRVNDAGAITLPDGRQIVVAGKTLAQIEADVVDAYYPQLVKTRPPVYAQVIEYATSRVRIMGAVTNPGLYELRHDQMSLVKLLMEAGGIIGEGAAVIRVTHHQGSDVRPSMDLGPAAFAPAGPALSSGPRRPVPVVYLCFEPEGPLETTGWLSVRQDGATAYREWLDIGSSHQRWAALGKIDAAVGIRGLAATDVKLAGLARLLTARPRSTQVHLAAYGTPRDWRRSDGDVFITSLDAGTSEDVPAVADSLGAPSPAAEASADSETTVVLPVKGMNIPFADVVLREGDSVVVERLTLQTISVLGLVTNPGSFPYPPGVTYNLAEALALAGGLDLVAQPRYVSVYRPKADGTVASATFQFAKKRRQEQLTEALTVKVKPGDIISVEHTPRTRTNVFFDRIVRISLGWYFNPDQFWNDND